MSAPAITGESNLMSAWIVPPVIIPIAIVLALVVLELYRVVQ
jgi:hypothetical protein